MNTTSSSSLFRRKAGITLSVLVILSAITLTHGQWRPAVNRWLAGDTNVAAPDQKTAHSGHDDHDDHDHTGHDHDAHGGHDAHDHEDNPFERRRRRLAAGGKSPDDVHASHDEHSHDDHGTHASEAADSTTLELSPAALKNLGLSDAFLKPIALSTYRRKISVPAVVKARPGRTQIHVSTPLTGVITHVHAVTGEAIEPGTLLFEIRLTHEELVTAQTEFLKALGELEVEKLEIARLESVAESGAVSGRSLLERKYARDKLEASIRAQTEALKLHGLSDRQVAEIATERLLLRSLQIVVPDVDRHEEHEELHLSGNPVQPAGYFRKDHGAAKSGTVLVVEDLSVHKGQSVAAGEKLCIVSDFRKLFIEGQAFDQDAPEIAHAAEQLWPVSAVFPGTAGNELLEDLQLAFVGTEVDLESRALAFYVGLSNAIVRDTKNDEGQRFVSWKYRPGQRLQLLVPVEEWQSQIVVPVDAVVREGAEWFVFRKNGETFRRVAVHVRHRDQTHVVIAADDTVRPGDIIALRSAHQMQMAIRNKSGAGADPHAGHHH
ncbi:MAG: efflux RND transporter periplasmic adaptor subunit [Planctomyces sp.]